MKKKITHNYSVKAITRTQTIIGVLLIVLIVSVGLMIVSLDLDAKSAPFSVEIVSNPLASMKGAKLSPVQLSSGEKQLLLLLCHAIYARKPGTIFIIDEPEISLNIVWQRELIQALMTCLEGTQFQVILATHSMELLSRCRQYVTPLENLLK